MTAILSSWGKQEYTLAARALNPAAGGSLPLIAFHHRLYSGSSHGSRCRTHLPSTFAVHPATHECCHIPKWLTV
jgi:hypothetical protein